MTKGTTNKGDDGVAFKSNSHLITEKKRKKIKSEVSTLKNQVETSLLAAVFFCLLSLATRKRVHVLLEKDLVICQIFL